MSKVKLDSSEWSSRGTATYPIGSIFIKFQKIFLNTVCGVVDPEASTKVNIKEMITAQNDTHCSKDPIFANLPSVQVKLCGGPTVGVTLLLRGPLFPCSPHVPCSPALLTVLCVCKGESKRKMERVRQGERESERGRGGLWREMRLRALLSSKRWGEREIEREKKGEREREPPRGDKVSQHQCQVWT